MLRTELLNAFSPATPVDEPSRFAGRQTQILRIADALMTAGQCPVVFGERGLGKSSVGKQIARIGLGDVELLDTLRARSYAIGTEQTFLPVYVVGSPQVQSLDDLVALLVAGTDAVVGSRESEPTLGNKSGIRIKIPIIAEVYFERSSAATPDAVGDVRAKWERLVASGERYLFVIDEFDTIPAIEGVAGFLKQHASDTIRFMPIGIADTVADLLHDHKSLERVIVPVEIPPMGDQELKEVIVKASQVLEEKTGSGFTVDQDAIDRLIDIACGFPWFVHALGKEALLRAGKRGNPIAIQSGDIEFAVENLIKNDLAQQYEDLYRRVVGNSQLREVLLRVLARWPAKDIPLKDTYYLARICKVVNPSNYKGQLVAERYGGVIVPHPTDKSSVRFENRLFQHFVNLRPSIYLGVADRVQAAWKLRFERMQQGGDDSFL